MHLGLRHSQEAGASGETTLSLGWIHWGPGDSQSPSCSEAERTCVKRNGYSLSRCGCLPCTDTGLISWRPGGGFSVLASCRWDRASPTDCHWLHMSRSPRWCSGLRFWEKGNKGIFGECWCLLDVIRAGDGLHAECRQGQLSVHHVASHAALLVQEQACKLCVVGALPSQALD